METQELGIIVDQLKYDLAQLEQHNTASHEKIYDRLRSLEISGPVTDLQFRQILSAIEDIKKDIKQFKADVDALKAKPGHKWENLTQTITACIATGILTYLLTMLIGG